MLDAFFIQDSELLLSAPNSVSNVLVLKYFESVFNEDMVQALLMLDALFIQDSEFEDLFCGASSGPKLSQ